MKRTIAVLSILAAFGCNRNETSGTETPPTQPEAVNVPADRPAADMPADKPAAENMGADKPAAEKMGVDRPAAANMPADNTGQNERDQRAETLTPSDQGESASDRTITQQARQGVVKADEVSVNGKNVKIITVDGVVTLRGPVESAREKKEIANIVKHVDGVKRIDNQLEVAAK